jgi:hypothetical protein
MIPVSLKNVKPIHQCPLVLGLILVCLIWYIYFHVLQVSLIYEVHATYIQMPADDKVLESWLKTQPGVLAHTVHIERQGNDIRAVFMLSKTIHGGAPPPDLSNTCDRFGYAPFTKWTKDYSSVE